MGVGASSCTSMNKEPGFSRLIHHCGGEAERQMREGYIARPCRTSIKANRRFWQVISSTKMTCQNLLLPRERKQLQTPFFSSENTSVTVEVIWTATFEQFCQCISHLFVRKTTWHRVQSYLRGLLSSVERKNGWQIAEATGAPTPYGVQYLLDRAKWDEDAMRDELRTYVCEALADLQAILVLDETGFLKKGTKSVGAQRQTIQRNSGTDRKLPNRGLSCLC